MGKKQLERERTAIWQFVHHCWLCEEKNADRIAARANLVLSAILAVIGLKFFTAEDELKVVAQHANCTARSLFWFFTAVGFVGLIVALCLVLEAKLKRPRPPASAAMTLVDPRKALLDTEDNALDLAINATYAASIDLYNRNRRRQSGVSTAQSVFLFSTASLVFALVEYLFLAYSSLTGGSGT